MNAQNGRMPGERGRHSNRRVGASLLLVIENKNVPTSRAIGLSLFAVSFAISVLYLYEELLLLRQDQCKFWKHFVKTPSNVLNLAQARPRCKAAVLPRQYVPVHGTSLAPATCT